MQLTSGVYTVGSQERNCGARFTNAWLTHMATGAREMPSLTNADMNPNPACINNPPTVSSNQAERNPSKTKQLAMRAVNPHNAPGMIRFMCGSPKRTKTWLTPRLTRALAHAAMMGLSTDAMGNFLWAFVNWTKHANSMPRETAMRAPSHWPRPCRTKRMIKSHTTGAKIKPSCGMALLLRQKVRLPSPGTHKTKQIMPTTKWDNGMSMPTLAQSHM
mmetsp:Transcript_46456/g.140962  ORF Transcript_46456/g.140962 Transcript_46456/m.140962 type:complete len:217 (+) Transcript_46456:369-1019(+)